MSRAPLSDEFGAGLARLWRLAALVIVLMLAGAGPALAQAPGGEPATLDAVASDQYGRLVLGFSRRSDLPKYTISAENSVLIIGFDEPVNVQMPDIPAYLPDFVTVVRIDPDHRGVRLALKDTFRINTIEAGEKLFIDILPPDWTGILPGLPNEVVQELSRRARDAGIDAERLRKAELVARDKPDVAFSIGRNPSFIRLQFDWSLDTSADFTFEAPEAKLRFALPVPIDMFDLKAHLPQEIVSADNTVTPDGSNIILTFAEGAVPRFYENTRRQFVVDVDLTGGPPEAVDIMSLLPEAKVIDAQKPEEQAAADAAAQTLNPEEQPVVRSTVTAVGSTVRIGFPFASRTAAAVFRRGNMLWLFFDTSAVVEQPDDMDMLGEVAETFNVVPGSGTQIVRINLSVDRLATLASDGQAWVLSLGDILLAAEAPMSFERVQDDTGKFSIKANLENPAKVHELRDPEAGDVLEVVTAYPPSRAVVRALEFVDFSALKTVHGLVIKPNHDEVSVKIAGDDTVVISAPRGLIVSAPHGTNARDAQRDAKIRDGFIDLGPYVEPDLGKFTERLEEMLQRASQVERNLEDSARLDLARYYLANQLGYEALGVVTFLRSRLVNQQLAPEARMLQAAANVAAGRAEDALDDLNAEDMSTQIDALMWRTIARAEALDYTGARTDALAAEDVVSAYPKWVQTAFLMAGIRAGLETGDAELTARLLGKIETASLDRDGLTRYELYSGWLDKEQGRLDEALDTFGQVIAADIRPTKAEAIYQTLKLLDRMGRLDPSRAAETLASEVMIWRGDELEAQMMSLLADLYFRIQNFRDAFETVHSVAVIYPDSPDVRKLLEQARQNFSDLYLNGEADALQPVEALTLYYDYREFTPPGTRGDEMVRNLARRLVKVDLLSQASELLEYQVNNRLEGAAKAQIAADLAVIDIADRKPQKALEVLDLSRVAGLPPSLERQRRVLEARALIDARREDLALDLLSSMDGRDADLLRIDAHWRTKRYQESAELIERLYSTTTSDETLSPAARQNLVRAAVGFVLANDRIGLSRLRSKFGERMSMSPEWPLFDFVTGEVSVTSVEFKLVAKEVADMDSLDAFLKSYRDVYEADGSLAPAKAAERTTSTASAL